LPSNTWLLPLGFASAKTAWKQIKIVFLSPLTPLKFPRTNFLYKKSHTTVPDNNLTKSDRITAHPTPAAVLQYSKRTSQRGGSAVVHRLRVCDQLGPGGQSPVPGGRQRFSGLGYRCLRGGTAGTPLLSSKK